MVLGLAVVVLAVIAGCGKQPESAMWASAHDLEMSGQYAKAVAGYQSLVKAYPTSPARNEALFRMGLMNLYGLQDTAAAAVCFRRVVSEAPRTAFGEGGRTLIDFLQSQEGSSRPEVLYHAGVAYTNLLSDYAHGVSILDELTTGFPGSERAAEAQFMKGFVWGQLGSRHGQGSRGLYSLFAKISRA